MSSRWKAISQFYIKRAGQWDRIRQGYIRVNNSSTMSSRWKRFYYEANLPTQTTAPTIRTTNNSGTGTIYDGPVATSPRYLNDDLFGKDGSYSNYTSIYGRKFSRASTSDATSRTTIVNDDRFTSAGGVTTAMRTACDEQFLFYELTVSNGGDDQIYPVSSPIKMIKNFPNLIDCGWTDVEQVGTQLNFNYSIENYYYNSIEPGSSYIRWWRSTNTNPGGTLLKEETITATTTGTPSSTSRSGTSSYTPTSSDLGYYIVAQIIAVSSYTRHNGYTDNYSLASFPTGGVITGPLEFSSIAVKDYYGNKGLDNRDRWPTGTLNQYTGTVSGWNSGTVLRIRYRIYNFDTGLYWKPSTGTQTTASAAWDSWNSDGSGNGYISNVSVSGGTATFYDYFSLDETKFNGGGSGPTWWLEIELSALRNGTRIFYNSSNLIPETYYISKRIDPTVSVSPSTVGLNTNVTISGTFAGFPATPSTNAYPRQYRVDYGDGTDSGWLPVGEWANGTLNPTYSLTKSYSTAGTYTIRTRSIPFGTEATTTVTVSSTKVPPTMGTPTISASGAFVSGQRRLSVPYTDVTGSGPAYQIYWYPGENYLGNAKPPVTASPDGSGTTSPIIDESGPNGIGRYAVWIRSAATTTTSGTTAPSTTLSDWSDLKYVYISGTRNLSYNKNTADTVTSLPSNTSGTDPWDGWVTTVSSNTPTRTGYTFNGYNTAADGSGTDYAAGASITLTSDVTLYVKWTANTYSVTYSGNGNTSGTAPDSQTKTHGVSLTLRTNTGSLAKTGFNFGGWNTATDGSGTDYAEGASYTGNAALTLYAKWTSNTFTVTFNANGGTGTMSNQTASTATALTKNTFTRSDTFVTPSFTGTLPGWTTANNFERTTSRIRWGWNNGTQTWSGTINDYTFSGWNTLQGGGGTAYADEASYPFTANVTLYAQWSTSRRSRGFNYQVRNANSTSTSTTVLLVNSFKNYTTTTDTRTVNGTTFVYVIGSPAEVTFTTSSRFARIQLYQFGTDGNEYNSGWTGNI